MRYSARLAAEATRGRLVGDDVALEGASFDSRVLRPGHLFVPLVAERDGHEFIAAAVAAGAPAYLTARTPDARAGSSAIVVPDTARALLDLGRWARDRLPCVGPRVVAITGSVGKTSVKDLTAAALGSRWRTAASPRSYNNEQGLPVALLGADDAAEALVLEMGMRGPGEIARLCEVARPSVGVVTMVAAAHTERVGGLDAVARAKAELVEALPREGVAVLNADDPRVAAMGGSTSARVVTFGRTCTADVVVTDLSLSDEAKASFTVVTPWGRTSVRLSIPGAHMAMNAAAALAAASMCDVPLVDAAAAVSEALVSPWRMELRRAPGGALVLNDAYNANPTSMRAALDTLAALPAVRRRAVLGLMAELDEPGPEHRAIAEAARQQGIELVVVGTDLYGVTPSADPVAALGALRPGDAVLVKGSRVARMESVVARLLEMRSSPS